MDKIDYPESLIRYARNLPKDQIDVVNRNAILEEDNFVKQFATLIKNIRKEIDDGRL